MANIGSQEETGGPQASLVQFQSSRKTKVTSDFLLHNLKLLDRDICIKIRHLIWLLLDSR